MNTHRLYTDYLELRVLKKLPTILSFPFSPNSGELEWLSLKLSEIALI